MGFSLYYHLKKGDSYHMATDRGAGLDALASGDAPSPPLDMRRRLIAQVRSCLQDYRIYLAGSVVIGLSGGKDSTALLTLLPDLGVRVIPVIVDLGYSSFDAEGIAASAAQPGSDPSSSVRGPAVPYPLYDSRLGNGSSPRSRRS